MAFAPANTLLLAVLLVQATSATVIRRDPMAAELSIGLALVNQSSPGAQSIPNSGVSVSTDSMGDFGQPVAWRQNLTVGGRVDVFQTVVWPIRLNKSIPHDDHVFPPVADDQLSMRMRSAMETVLHKTFPHDTRFRLFRFATTNLIFEWNRRPIGSTSSSATHFCAFASTERYAG